MATSKPTSPPVSTALVGPLRQVRFRGGARLVADPPRDTLDPRWQRCTEHRTACDCREAERTEQITELAGEIRQVERVAQDLLAGHPIHGWSEDGYVSLRCQCTGCQIVRAAHIYVRTDDHGVVVDPAGPSTGDRP